MSTISLEATEAASNNAIEFNMDISVETFTLGLSLITLQFLDAYLTAAGVGSLGLAAEGNIFIRALMAKLGVISTLVIVKTVAIMAILVLCSLAVHVSWVKRIMRMVIYLYLGVAVVPWTIVLLTRVA